MYQSGQDYYNHLAAIGNSNHVPTSAIIELTYRCNLSCPHCYLEEPTAHTHHSKELSGKQFCAILDQLPSLGTFFTTFQGGEVYIHPDWKMILSHARNLGMFVGIKTNATMLTPERLDFLESLMPMFEAQISVYGMNPETFDAVAGVKGSFYKFEKAVLEMHRRKIKFDMMMLVTKKNVHQAGLAKEWAKSLGVFFGFNHNVVRQVDGGIRPLEEKLSVEELLAFEKKYFKNNNRYYSCGQKDRYDCPLGKTSFVITPYGKMNFCVDMGEPQLDVLESSVATRWMELQKHSLRIKESMNQGCGNCSLFKGCSACAADLWHENASFKSCSPHYKSWAQARLANVFSTHSSNIQTIMSEDKPEET